MSEIAELRRLRWFNELVSRAIDAGASDAGEAVASAELALSVQPEPPEGMELAIEDWQPYKIQRGPRKGKDVWKNARTGQLSDDRPKEGAEPKPKRFEDERGNQIGNAHRQNMRAFLGKMRKGEYAATDVLEDIEQYADRAGAAEQHNWRSRYRWFRERFRETRGDDAIESDEWQSVRAAFQEGMHKSLEALDDMAEAIRAVARFEIREGNPDDAATHINQGDVEWIDNAYSNFMEAHQQSVATTSEALKAFAAKWPSIQAALSLDDPDELWATRLRKESPESIFLAHDIFNPRAQAILNRALKASANLTDRARRDLRTILDLRDPAAVAREVTRWVGRYRLELAQLLTTTQISAVLEGAREVVKALPRVPPVGFPSTPPTMEPEQALATVERLQGLPQAERETEIARLTPAEQGFVRQGMRHAIMPAPVFEPRGEVEGEEEFVFITNAARELSSKNVLTRPQYDLLEAAARQKAFTVAGVDAQATLEKIRDTLSENVAQGADYETWRAKVLESVEEGTFLSEPHVEVVFRQNVQGAFSDGQIQVLQHPFVRGALPYAVYDAIDDDRVRHNHMALETLGIDGTNVYRVDDPVFKKFRPPWDWNDRCSWYAITVRQAAEKGVKEAIRWLADGVEPSPPAFVRHPPFDVPEGFQRVLQGAPLSVRLSMIALSDEHWITVGGHAEGGRKHVGGFPIQINKDGEILSGPAGLKGKKVSEIKEHFDKLRGKKSEKKEEKSSTAVDKSSTAVDNVSGGADIQPQKTETKMKTQKITHRLGTWVPDSGPDGGHMEVRRDPLPKGHELPEGTITAVKFNRNTGVAEYTVRLRSPEQEQVHQTSQRIATLRSQINNPDMPDIARLKHAEELSQLRPEEFGDLPNQIRGRIAQQEQRKQAAVKHRTQQAASEEQWETSEKPQVVARLRELNIPDDIAGDLANYYAEELEGGDPQEWYDALVEDIKSGKLDEDEGYFGDRPEWASLVKRLRGAR